MTSPGKSAESKPVISECNEDTNKSGLFKLNGWKTTLCIILVSLIVRSLIRSNAPTVHKTRDDGFLDLVPEKYDDKDLFDWEPVPAPISRPEEPGDLGGSVEIPEHLKALSESRFSEHYFDVVANELMSLNRTLPDVRYPECVNIKYAEKLPQVSVVIVFYNEAWSTLIRTVWSVITQSPRSLLKEIILVDDHSSYDHLGEKLEKYLPNFPIPVSVARTKSRVGLIQARLLGASQAKGKVMVFLDAHCECSQGWLEPLLTPIVESRSTVVAPTIDVISFTNMEYRTAEINTRGSFDVGLSFIWDSMPQRIADLVERDRAANIESPAMAGGLFAIDREYFYEVGSYDEEMSIWGGENIEMSIRIWSCGGRLLSSPCSRVGHIFRDTSPYLNSDDASRIITRNLARLADVWLDEYKDIFYAFSPDALKVRSDVTERVLLREKLKCKSFKWYLDNIFPESPFSMDVSAIVEIESAAEEGKCLDSMGASPVNNRSLEIYPCHRLGGNQMFMITNKGEIRDKKFCWDATSPGQPVNLLECHGLKGNQFWSYDVKENLIRHSSGENCLTRSEDSSILSIDKCIGSSYQQWYLTPTDDDDGENDEYYEFDE